MGVECYGVVMWVESVLIGLFVYRSRSRLEKDVDSCSLCARRMRSARLSGCRDSRLEVGRSD